MNLAQCEEHDPTTGTGLTLSKWTHLLSHCAAENEQTNVRRRCLYLLVVKLFHKLVSIIRYEVKK